MRVGIIGATGYGGVELLRFLKHHPHVTQVQVISSSQQDAEFIAIYPHLTGVVHATLQTMDVERMATEVDVVFFATPAGVSKEYAPKLVERGVVCIDLSGDFRLKSASLYEKWYKHAPADQAYIDQAVYGLSEVYAEEVREANLIANPGCYPTATLLGLIPLLAEGFIEQDSIIVDGKSGISGAGRSASLGTHYAEVNENVKAYKLGVHQHIPEIEQCLGDVSKTDVTITFSTHLMPMTRGIMCTMYAKLTEKLTTQEVVQLYQQFYAQHPFVRVRPVGVYPATKEVYGSNYCDLGFMVDPRTNRVTIVSVIDNVGKGAAGQAIQNMNIRFGLDVRAGLEIVPIYP